VAVSVEAWEGVAIELDRAVARFATNEPILMTLSAPDGRVIGPFPVVVPDGSGPVWQVSITTEEMDRIAADYGGDPRDWIARGPARDEPIRAVIGPASTLQMRLIVQEVGEERGGYARITCVDDDPRAHEVAVAADGGLDGVITGITGTLFLSFPGDGGVVIDLAVDASADVAALAFLYEYSADFGLVWQPLGTSPDPSLTVSPTPAGLTDLRAAATRDGARGPWVATSLAGGALAAPAGLAEVTPGLFGSDARLHVAASPVTGAASYRFSLFGGDGLMGVLFRAAPEIDLTVDELAAAGLASRTTTVRLTALDNSGQPGAEAELVLPAVPPPGAPSGFPSADTGDTIVTTVTWQDGTPPPTRGWLVAWNGGSKTVPSAEFWRGDAGWADPLTFTGLDAFGAGESVTVSFVVPSYNGP
jgi:hypothetical protein